MLSQGGWATLVACIFVPGPAPIQLARVIRRSFGLETGMLIGLLRGQGARVLP